MVERNRLSSGFNASIFVNRGLEKLYFPKADLMKEDNSSIFGDSFVSRFYEHKIASLLFPDNFIDVVGAQRDQKTGRARIFSKVADISSQHAAFSDHMSNSSGRKVSIHDCNDCVEHRAFHQEKNLENKAREVGLVIGKTGINAPFDDSSDYCLSNKTGGIVFFEIDDFNDGILNYYFSILQKPSDQEKKAQKLLERYRTLMQNRILFRINHI